MRASRMRFHESGPLPNGSCLHVDPLDFRERLRPPLLVPEQKRVSRQVRRILVVFGVLSIVLGLTLNEFVLARAGAGEGSLRPGGARTTIWIVQLLLVTAGAAILVLRRQEIAVNLTLAWVSTLVFSALCSEILLRAAIGLGIEGVRNPRLYAGWCDDDDQWKLRYRWLTESRKALGSSGFAFDPTVGWVAPGVPEEGGEAVLLYGDSFAYGVQPTPIPMRLAGQLDRLLVDLPVVNYAVSGYGLDQTYLRFRTTHARWQEPTIVFGLMTMNLDRAILTVRDAPKPYFKLVGHRLELAGVPLPRDVSAWHRDHPPRIRSYVAAWSMRQLQLAMGPGPETEIPYRQAEKQRLGRRLLKAMVEEAAARDLRIVVVLFYPLWELEIEGWRETFLKRELERLKVPYLDTKTLFLTESARTSRDIGDYVYPPPNNHPNEEGNRLVAEAVAQMLEMPRSGA